MNTHKHEQVVVGSLRSGDTVLIGGHLKTICAKDLGRDELFGPTLWGNSYKAGHGTVTKVTFWAELRRQETSRGDAS